MVPDFFAWPIGPRRWGLLNVSGNQGTIALSGTVAWEDEFLMSSVAYQTTCTFDLRRIDSRITLRDRWRRCNLEPPRIYANRGPLREAFKAPALEPARHWETWVDTASVPRNEASAIPQSRAAQVSLVVFFASFVTAAALPSDSTVTMTSKKVELGCLGPSHCIKYFHVCPRLLRFFRFFLDSGLYVPATLCNPTTTKRSVFAPEANVVASLAEVWSTPSSAHINPTKQA